MDNFLKNLEYSPKQFGQFLSKVLSKLINEDYDKFALSLIKLLSETSEQPACLKEWIVIEIWSMSLAITLGVKHYIKTSKGNQKFFQLLDHYKHSCGEFLVKSNVFSTMDVFNGLLQLRFQEYNNALFNKEYPGGPYWVSKKIIGNLNGNDKDITKTMAAAEYFTTSFKTKKEYIKTLMKRIKIIW